MHELKLGEQSTLGGGQMNNARELIRSIPAGKKAIREGSSENASGKELI